MTRYRLYQGKNREHWEGEWVRYEDHVAAITLLRDNLRRVRDWMKHAANSAGGILNEMDHILKETEP